jgi:hypothetical protein
MVVLKALIILSHYVYMHSDKSIKEKPYANTLGLFGITVFTLAIHKSYKLKHQWFFVSFFYYYQCLEH